jgi:hypothetical protein
MSIAEPNIYIYKVVADSGGAPCVSGNLLSLAICKPKIRKTAEKGSLIFGFGGKEYDERLIYIARVTAKVEGDTYFRQRKYARRPDCIYRVENDHPVRKVSARYHSDSDQSEKDVGYNFENAFVLLSDDFRYLGQEGTDDFKRKYPKLRKRIESLKQGHRRFHSAELRDELLALKAEIWRKYRKMKVGNPSDTDRSRLCNRECPSASY